MDFSPTRNNSAYEAAKQKRQVQLKYQGHLAVGYNKKKKKNRDLAADDENGAPISGGEEPDYSETIRRAPAVERRMTDIGSSNRRGGATEGRRADIGNTMKRAPGDGRRNAIENGNSLRRTPIDGRRSELQTNNQISLNNRQANVLNGNAYGAGPYENLNVA